MAETKHRITYVLTSLFVALIFTSCNLGYKVNNDKVYYKYWHTGMGIETKTFEIVGADAQTFKVLDKDNYAIDQKQAYYKGEPILNADPKTFKAILDYYAKDNYRAFKENKTIDKADGKSFTVIEDGPYSRDDKDFYFDTIALNVNDVKSFRILNKIEEYGYWAKDKTHYYILSKKYPLADYETFINIGNGYAKDKFNAYYLDSIVAGADPLTFKSSEYGYAEDKNSKYDGHKKLNIQSPLSYQSIGEGYGKDKQYVYFGDSIIMNADPLTFQVINWRWQKDKSYYFYQGKAMKKIDYSTFTLLLCNYSKDKNSVYYYDKEVVGADPTTFIVRAAPGIDLGKDKSNCFQYGERVDCNKTKSE